MNRFTISARLPGLNELISANRANRYKGAALKKETDTLIRFVIRAAVRRGECWPVVLPAAVNLHFQERNRRRDLDNVFSSAKFILDAMKAEGIIRDDSQRYVRILAYSFEVGDADEITVTITTLEGKENGNQTENK